MTTKQETPTSSPLVRVQNPGGSTNAQGTDRPDSFNRRNEIPQQLTAAELADAERFFDSDDDSWDATWKSDDDEPQAPELRIVEPAPATPGDWISQKVRERHRDQLAAIAPDVVSEYVASVDNCSRHRDFSPAGCLVFRNVGPDGKERRVHKPDKPELDENGRPKKYVGAPGERGLIVHHTMRSLLHDTTADLVVVEGQKQYLSVVSALRGQRVCVIGIAGIWNWGWKPGGKNTPSVPLPDWGYIALKGRKVYTVPDGDYGDNTGVRAGADALAEHLGAQGAETFRVAIPLHHNEKTGADDHLGRFAPDERQGEALRLMEEAREGGGARVEALLARLLDAAGLENLADPEPLIKGWLTLDTLARINGEPGSAKSLTALDWAGSVGTGTPWHGFEVTQGAVVYIVAEGARGFKKRVKAWQIKHGKPMQNVHFLPEPLQVMGSEWDAYTQVCKRLGAKLIVLDTQRRVTVGITENDNTELGQVVERLDDLRRATGACVLLAHHTTKGGTTGSGGGAVTGGLNTEFLMTKKKNGTTRYVLTNEKEKDEAEGATMTFVLEVINVGGDPEDPFAVDAPATSVVLVPDDTDADDAANPLPSLADDAAPSRRQVLQIISKVWGPSADDFAKGEVKALAKKVMDDSTFYRAWNELVAQGQIVAVPLASGAASKTHFTAVRTEF